MHQRRRQRWYVLHMTATGLRQIHQAGPRTLIFTYAQARSSLLLPGIDIDISPSFARDGIFQVR